MTRVARHAAPRPRGLAALALLLLWLAPLAGCGKYGPPRRVSHARADGTTATSADGEACEEPKPPQEQPAKPPEPQP